MATKNIVFDLGGVLVDWNPNYLYKNIFDTREETDFFLENICNLAWNARQDAGRTLEEATRVLIEQHPDFSIQIKVYYERWTEMFNGHIQGSVDILSQLRSNGDYRLLALTNWSGETFPIALQIFDFFQWFEGIVVSGDEKLIKPDHRLYQILFDRYNIHPGESIFIDDSLANITAAKELGMTGIHFTNPDQLSNELKVIEVL